MAWVYDSPLTSSEQKVYKVLKQKLDEGNVAKTTVKIMSLYSFLKSSKFSSPKELRESTRLTSSKRSPIFTEEQAKSIFAALKKRGGADSKYPFTDHVAKQGLDFATTLVPEGVKDTVTSVYGLATSPVRIVKENVPFGDLLIGAMHGATETGVTVAGDVAEGAGGPVGAAFIAPFTALAAGMASLVSLGEQDLGQAVAHIANAVPVMGSAFGKGLTQIEHQVENLKTHPEVAEFIPFVGEYVTGRPTKSFSLDSLQEQAKARATAELQKRGLPTSLEDAQSKVQSRGMAELQKRGLPTSATDLQTQAKSRGMAELQKRGLPTSATDLQTQAKSRGMAELAKRGLPTSATDLQGALQSRATAELQKRLPTIPQAAGKRFSTQRRKYTKWPKTRRSKSARA
jgi:hypothetical protein